MKAAEKTYAGKQLKQEQSLIHTLFMNHFVPVSYLLLDVHAGSPSTLSCELLYTTICLLDLPEPPLPPPPPPLPLPLRSTLSSLSNQISCSSSPSTIFHFIKLSYLKLNESPARFLLSFFFLIPAWSFHNFPTSADPFLPSILLISITFCLPSSVDSPPHREQWGGILFLRGGSVS